MGIEGHSGSSGTGKSSCVNADKNWTGKQSLKMMQKVWSSTQDVFWVFIFNCLSKAGNAPSSKDRVVGFFGKYVVLVEH